MRIGEPARKHGIAEADVLHAVRNAIRSVGMDEDLVMLIGPARDSALLEIGVLDLEGSYDWKLWMVDLKKGAAYLPE